MLDPANYPFCSEFYIVEKSIEVVAKINGENRQIRIDALRGPDSTARYIRLPTSRKTSLCSLRTPKPMAASTVSRKACKFGLPMIFHGRQGTQLMMLSLRRFPF